MRLAQPAQAPAIPVRRGAPITPAAFAVAKPVKKKPLQHRIAAAFTILLVPGFIAATSIPAFAVGTPPVETQVFTASVAENAQTVAVGASVDAVEIDRGNYDATTHSELKAKKAAAAARAYAAIAARTAASNAASDGDYSKVDGPRAAGDDYPFRGYSGLSPLNYVARQCTDFVAWRLNRDAGSTKAPYKYVWSNMTPGGGSASAWASAWKNNGWKTSSKPVAGAVAWFSGNHVAYVKSVDGGNVNLEEYNWNGSTSYHTRTISSSSVALFLYPPP